MGLELAEVVMGIEEEFELQFPEEAPLTWNVATVGDLIDFTAALCRQRPPTKAPPDTGCADVARRVITIVGTVACLPPEKIRREHGLIDVLAL